MVKLGFVPYRGKGANMDLVFFYPNNFNPVNNFEMLKTGFYRQIPPVRDY